MSKRPTLTLKRKRVPDTLAELLDQPPAGPSEFHPHTQVKASTDVVGDLDRLIDTIRHFADQYFAGGPHSQAQADQWKNIVSGLACRLGNRMSAEPRQPALGVRKWTLRD